VTFLLGQTQTNSNSVTEKAQRGVNRAEEPTRGQVYPRSTVTSRASAIFAVGELKPTPQLVDFLVEAAGGGAVLRQRPEIPFSIKVTARDGTVTHSRRLRHGGHYLDGYAEAAEAARPLRSSMESLSLTV